MMKRLLAFFLTWTIVMGVVLPCYAAEESVSASGDSVTGNVYARSVRSTQWEEASVNNGQAEVITDDGYIITVTGIPSECVVLKVFSIPSSEYSAREWLADCIGEKYDIQEAFDIFFEDTDGNRINANGVEITIQGRNNNCTIHSVSITSRTQELDNTGENGVIRFTATGSHYYVLAADVSAEGTIDSMDSSMDDKSKVPATGDTSCFLLWGILVIVSCVSLTRLLLWRKGQNTK